jgi:hypothetical protein
MVCPKILSGMALCLALSVAAVTPNAALGSPQNTSNAASDNVLGTLTLPDGSKFRTTLYELKVIGELRTAKKIPYFILSGRGCDECDANTSIYIHSPSDGAMKNEGEQPRFPYPGRLRDNENDQLVYEARMFYGNCFRSYPNAVVWFERNLSEDKTWHEDILIAGVKDDHFFTTTLQRDFPKITDAQDAIRTGQCHELPGIDGHTEP